MSTVANDAITAHGGGELVDLKAPCRRAGAALTRTPQSSRP